MVTPGSATPRLVALDWGSTRLRAWLLGEHGVILAERQNASGASTLAGGAPAFEQALAALAGDWLDSALPIVACGMVGSTHGWREAPYVECPGRLDALHERLLPIATSTGATVWIVPGMVDAPPEAAPDVMRGEETQVLGLVHAQPALAARACVLMPGTHSKWVQMRDGIVAGFRTRVTGEAYALLRHQSVLARLMPADDAASHPAAFAAGVAAARRAGGTDLLGQLFATRTLGLTRQRSGVELVDYLSGLLIGHELIAGLQEADGPIAIVGESALSRRYMQALEMFGVTPAIVRENTACAGLWRLAVQARWVQA